MKSLSLIVSLLYFFSLLGVLGFYSYLHYYHKNPKITEGTELARLKKVYSSQHPTQKKPLLIPFEPLTVNIQSVPPKGGKVHYVTLGFSVEIQDETQAAFFTELHSILWDQLIDRVGKKSYHELANVQGRSILELEMVDFLNQWIEQHTSPPPLEPLVSRFYWTQFIVQ